MVQGYPFSGMITQRSPFSATKIHVAIRARRLEGHSETHSESGIAMEPRFALYRALQQRFLVRPKSHAAKLEGAGLIHARLTGLRQR